MNVVNKLRSNGKWEVLRFPTPAAMGNTDRLLGTFVLADMKNLKSMWRAGLDRNEDLSLAQHSASQKRPARDLRKSQDVP